MIAALRQGLKDDGYEVSISKLCQWFGVARRSVRYRKFKRPFRPVCAVAEAAGVAASVGLARFSRGWGLIAARFGGLMGVRQHRSLQFPAGGRQRVERSPARSWPHRMVLRVSPVRRG